MINRQKSLVYLAALLLPLSGCVAPQPTFTMMSATEGTNELFLLNTTTGELYVCGATSGDNPFMGCIEFPDNPAVRSQP